MKLSRWMSSAMLLALSLGASARAADTVQNFSAVFATGGGGLAPSILPYQAASTIDVVDSADGAWDGRAVRLTQEINSQNTGFSLNPLVGGSFASLQFDWEMTISPGNGGGADGIGFGYANVADYGNNNNSPFPDWGTSEEPNLAGSLGIGFDTFNNTDLGDNGENSVSLHFNTARLDSIPLADGFLESGNRLQATVLMTPVAGGSNVSVTVTDLDSATVETPFINEFVAGLNPYVGRPAFKGRTGGANSQQIVDNFKVTLTPTGGGAPTIVTENFNSLPLGELVPPPVPDNPPLVGGTPYTEFQGGSVPGVRLVNQTESGGAQPGHMQLTANTGSQVNSIAFDKTSDKADNIQASFKYRINNSGNNADGMSFMILSADTYGDTGELNGGFSEDPNLAGALGVGFDTFDNDEEGLVDPTGCGDGGSCGDRRANHFSLHWDGAAVDLNGDGIQDTKDYVLLPQGELDLVNNNWNDVNLIARQTNDGMVVTMTVTDGSDGSVHPIFVDQLVPGSAFASGARAAFGGRTGGAASVQLIDEVNIKWTGSVLNPCDFNEDGSLNVQDIDLLRDAVRLGGAAKFDVNKDGSINTDDIAALVEGRDKFNTYVGDVNLDGQFNTTDIVAAFVVGEYEDATNDNSTWADGDWDGDADFGTGDLVFAFTRGGYELGPRAAVAAVPEPSSLALLALSGLLCIRRRK